MFTSIWPIEDKQELGQTFDRAPRLTRPPISAHISMDVFYQNTQGSMEFKIIVVS